MRSFRLLAPVAMLLAACGGDTLHGLKNQPPVAVAGRDLSSLVGETIRFDGSKSHDPDGEIATFAWTFGDGAKATGEVVTHAYASAGTFDVTLTVTDDEGAKGEATLHATIANPDLPPTAVIVVSTNAAHTGDTVSFDGTRSTDDGSIVAFAWDFGDGQSATGALATHPFAAAGAYTVKLTVTDDAGQTGSDTTVVRVADPPPPAAIFPATYDYAPVDPSSTSSCYGFEAEPLTFTIPSPDAATSSCTIQEGSGFLSATYTGTYTSATRHFHATYSSLGSAQTMDGTFAADFKSFDGTYSGGSCSTDIVIHGTRTNPP